MRADQEVDELECIVSSQLMFYEAAVQIWVSGIENCLDLQWGVSRPPRKSGSWKSKFMILETGQPTFMYVGNVPIADARSGVNRTFDFLPEIRKPTL